MVAVKYDPYNHPRSSPGFMEEFYDAPRARHAVRCAGLREGVHCRARRARYSEGMSIGGVTVLEEKRPSIFWKYFRMRGMIPNETLAESSSVVLDFPASPSDPIVQRTLVAITDPNPTYCQHPLFLDLRSNCRRRKYRFTRWYLKLLLTHWSTTLCNYCFAYIHRHALLILRDPSLHPIRAQQKPSSLSGAVDLAVLF